MIDPWNRVLTNLKIAETGVCSNISSSEDNLPSSFPVLVVEATEAYDTALDMENSENAIMSIMRLVAYSKTNLTEARKVMSIACDAMRQMGYRRYYGPKPVPNVAHGMVYRVEARFRRFVSDVETDIPKFPTE